jgi:hypothetical protein
LAPEENPVLVGIDVHGIRPDGFEPYHLHHDLVFVFTAESEECHPSEESWAVSWCTPEAFERYRVPASVRTAHSRALQALPSDIRP